MITPCRPRSAGWSSTSIHVDRLPDGGEVPLEQQRITRWIFDNSQVAAFECLLEPGRDTHRALHLEGDELEYRPVGGGYFRQSAAADKQRNVVGTDLLGGGECQYPIPLAE